MQLDSQQLITNFMKEITNYVEGNQFSGTVARQCNYPRYCIYMP